MMQSMQQIAAQRPSCLFRETPGGADGQQYASAGREIDGTTDRRTFLPLTSIDDKPIRHELHRFLLLSMVATTVQECGLGFWIE
jgi:hypothetical protein